MSRNVYKDSPTAPGRVVSTGPSPKANRFQLDYASWHACIAAPGSRIGMALSRTHPIVRLDTAADPAKSAGLERRIA
jgi:hypothetical protein